MPIISVVVPAYNKPEYLPECLESIRAQTFRDWECIVVDDGSPRGEEIRAAVAGMRDERFRLVRHEVNRGLAAARNTGVKHARANLLIWVDEDDQLKAETLGKLLEEMQRTGADIIHPQYINMATGRVFSRLKVPPMAEALARQHFNGVGFLIRRRAFEKIGDYDESPMIRLGREDTEWWIRAVAAQVRVHILARGLYLYRPNMPLDGDWSSLDLRATLHERKIRRYIVAKHSALYARHPEARRRFLLTGLRREIQAQELAGRWGRAAVLRWQYFAQVRSKKALSEAIASLIRALCGEQGLSAARRLWAFVKPVLGRS